MERRGAVAVPRDCGAAGGLRLSVDTGTAAVAAADEEDEEEEWAGSLAASPICKVSGAAAASAEEGEAE